MQKTLLYVLAFIIASNTIFYPEQVQSKALLLYREDTFQTEQIWLELKTEKKNDSRLYVAFITHNDIPSFLIWCRALVIAHTL
jgi:hypothetical protein